MIKFFYHPSPNPAKVALFLEESGVEYELVPVDIRKGEQHTAAYRQINPNGKTPAILDGDTAVFDSTAILIYLAEKTDQFLLPKGPKGRAELLSWLAFISSGLAPNSGQSYYFAALAPERVPFATQRFGFEAHRHWSIINDRLADRRYLLGDAYTIADISLWGWARIAPALLGPAFDQMPHLKRLLNEINARPAAIRAEALKDHHVYKEDMDEEARRHMFPHQGAS